MPVHTIEVQMRGPEAGQMLTTVIRLDAIDSIQQAPDKTAVLLLGSGVEIHTEDPFPVVYKKLFMFWESEG